jgi:predicted metalloprotease with PDZ domain
MQALWQRYGQPFYKGKQDGLKESELVELIKDVTQVDVTEEIDMWVNQTADVPLQDLLAAEGFDLQWISKDDMPNLGLTFKTQGESLVVRQVFEDSAAHRAGLSAGDVLIAVNGLRIGHSTAALKEVLRAYRAGDRVTLHCFRADVLRTASLQIQPPAKAACQILPLRH